MVRNHLSVKKKRWVSNQGTPLRTGKKRTWTSNLSNVRGAWPDPQQEKISYAHV